MPDQDSARQLRPILHYVPPFSTLVVSPTASPRLGDIVYVYGSATVYCSPPPPPTAPPAWRALPSSAGPLPPPRRFDIHMHVFVVRNVEQSPKARRGDPTWTPSAGRGRGGGSAGCGRGGRHRGSAPHASCPFRGRGRRVASPRAALCDGFAFGRRAACLVVRTLAQLLIGRSSAALAALTIRPVLFLGALRGPLLGILAAGTARKGGAAPTDAGDAAPPDTPDPLCGPRHARTALARTALGSGPHGRA